MTMATRDDVVEAVRQLVKVMYEDIVCVEYEGLYEDEIQRLVDVLEERYG